MTDNKPGLTFGLNEAVPPEAKVAWGARLIIRENHGYKQYIRGGCRGRRPKQFSVEFVRNRQSFVGEHVTAAGFERALNKGGMRKSAIILAIKEIERMFNSFEWNLQCGGPQSAGPKVVFEDERLRVIADPRDSGGYVYVCAFPLPAAQAK